MNNTKKKIKPVALWSIDLNYKESDGPAQYPLYEIYADGPYFSIRYHGCCEIHTSTDLESAKQYCRSDLKYR